jgi:hypothetical protein
MMRWPSFSFFQRQENGFPSGFLLFSMQVNYLCWKQLSECQIPIVAKF